MPSVTRKEVEAIFPIAKADRTPAQQAKVDLWFRVDPEPEHWSEFVEHDED